MLPVTVHDQPYEFLSWEELGQQMFVLAQKILQDHREFDRVIALAKGGLAFSRSLVDYLNIKSISSIQIEFYTGINARNRTPVITQSLPVNIQNERILIFDDIVDKGDTMAMAVDYLRYHGAQEITTSSLVSKPWSKFLVDYSSHSSQAWVIFPNEIRETIKLLSNIWREKGDSTDQIVAQLLKIGFPKAEVEFFAKIK